ncbi:MAG: hypothetical protein ACJAZK_001633 [Psychroserpens sp.]|jgi:hypothetical protein
MILSCGRITMKLLSIIYSLNKRLLKELNVSRFLEHELIIKRLKFLLRPLGMFLK